VGSLHQLDALADRGMRRDSIQIAQLIDAHAQGDTNFGLWRARNASGDQVIELGLMAQASEDDLSGKTRIARVERNGALEQKIRGIATLVDFAENIEGDLARGRDQVLF
jgi:hypothetical protein